MCSVYCNAWETCQDSVKFHLVVRIEITLIRVDDCCLYIDILFKGKNSQCRPSGGLVNDQFYLRFCTNINYVGLQLQRSRKLNIFHAGSGFFHKYHQFYLGLTLTYALAFEFI